MTEDTFDIMQFADDTQSEGGGARPMTCKVRIDGGYVSYAPGLSPQERFFSAAEYGKDDAHEMAKAVSAPHGASTSPVVRMTVYKNAVLDRDTSNWKYDTWPHDYITWQSAYTEVFLPSLKKAIEDGFVQAWDNWVRLEFVPDPYKPKRNDGTTNNRAFIAEVYRDRNAAAEAVGVAVSDETGREIPSEPAQWVSVDDGEGSWTRFFNSLIDTFKANPQASMTDMVLSEGGVTLEIVMAAKSIADDESMPF